MSEARLSVLIADDEADIRDFLAETLAREGFEVLTAADGEEAHAIWRRERPDLVLSDIMMPGTDGTELLRRIREEDAEQLVIIFSSFDKPIESLRLRASDYIAKPVNRNELLHRIRVNLENFRMRRRLEELEQQRRRMKFLEAEWRSFGSHEYNTRLNGLTNLIDLSRDEVRELKDLCGGLRDPAGRSAAAEGLAAYDFSDLEEFLRLASSRMRQFTEEGELFREYYSLTEERISRRRVAVDPFLRGILETIRERYVACGREDLHLVYRGDGGAELSIDPDLVARKVVEEFAINASRHTNDGAVYLEWENRRDEILIRVRDEGDGIEEQYADKVFLPRIYAHNYLYHSSVHENPLEYGRSGYGMGLTIAKRVVELHRGQIGFESRPGGGTSFWCSFPAVHNGAEESSDE